MKIGICGVGGSGKSTLSKEIAEKFDLDYIEVDKYNIILIKRFSVILEKFWDLHAYQSSDVHVLNGLKNFKKIRKSEQKLYNALKKRIFFLDCLIKLMKY